jgi:hypothetical protein
MKNLKIGFVAFRALQKRRHPDHQFSELNTHPVYSPVYASPCTSRSPTQNSGPSGSLLLSRKASSSSASCRFSPAHCNRLWLLKNSLSRNRQKLERVRMPYKRFSRVCYTFQVTDFGAISSKRELSVVQPSDSLNEPGVTQVFFHLPRLRLGELPYILDEGTGSVGRGIR